MTQPARPDVRSLLEQLEDVRAVIASVSDAYFPDRERSALEDREQRAVLRSARRLLEQLEKSSEDFLGTAAHEHLPGAVVEHYLFASAPLPAPTVPVNVVASSCNRVGGILGSLVASYDEEREAFDVTTDDLVSALWAVTGELDALGTVLERVKPEPEPVAV